MRVVCKEVVYFLLVERKQMLTYAADIINPIDGVALIVFVKIVFLHDAKLLIFLRFTMHPMLGNHAELGQFRFAYGNPEVPKSTQLTPYLFGGEYIVYCGKRPEVMLTAPVYRGVKIHFDDSFIFCHSYFL